MSGIFGVLSSTAAALEAQRRGLEVTGQNIANVNTAGYSRRVIQLAERAPVAPGEAGRGVSVADIHAVRDGFLESRVRQEQQALAHDQVIVEALSVLEAQLGQPGASVDGQLSALFNAFSALAEDPASLTLRDAVWREADRLAVGLRDMAGRFARARYDADLGVRSTVDQINHLAADIGRLNARIGEGVGLDLESLVDQRNVALGALADLVDIRVTEGSGTLTVALASGPALVSGAHVVGLEVADGAGDGLARVLSRGEDVTAALEGGRVAGWRAMRDDRVPAYAAMLDRLAFDVATAVNAVHQSGTDADGLPGGALFDVPATAEGAAAAMAVSAGVAADAARVVAAGAAANDAARAMAALRDAPLVGGTTTAAGYWGQIVYRVGGDAAAAQRTEEGRRQVVAQLQRLREATSGVSLDEEAAALMRFQRAYEANARYFTTVNDVLDLLMGMVR